MEALVSAALRAHAPFDEMEPEPLAYLAARLKLAYYPKGERVIGPESGRADRLFIVKQGCVRRSGGRADRLIAAGEMFSIDALLARRPTFATYRAEADTFCWELPAEAFYALLDRSERFRAYCNDYVAMLVERSQRALRAEAAEAALDDARMLAPLRSVLARSPVCCTGETPVREVIRTLQRERVGSMVVVDEAQRPVGIFTRQDVLERVALSQTAADAPIISLMTPFPFALEEEATLADAALAMVRHGVRHVVVTRDGRLTGVVSERDLFALQRVGLQRTAERIRHARTLEELAGAARDIRQLARGLLAQGVGAEPLTAMMSALNDALTRRVIDLAAAHAKLPPHWCWLALGSEGRMEQTLVTDQDNGLIFLPEANVEAERRALVAFADEVNRGLDACGFPLCPGNIMARNPRWCLTLDEWRRVFSGWIGEPDSEALLNASIFFDFRPLAGEARLAGELRDGVLAKARANRLFCRALAETALGARPPLGLIADFSEREIDLKLLGARPFVDAARVLALAAGIGETGTAARLRAVGEPGAADAFHFVQALRLQRERNRVRVEELSAIDRRLLREAFRQAAVLQQRLRLDYQL